MPYFFVIAAGGAVVSAGVAAARGLSRKPTLADALAPVTPPPKSLPGNWSGRLARVENAYHRMVRTHLDPWLAGRERYRHMQEMAGGELPEPGDFDKALNRQLGMGMASLGLLALAPFTPLPLPLLVLACGLYISWPFFLRAYHLAVHERRFSIFQLLMLYFAFLWLGGHYLIGMIGAMLNSLSQKIEVFTETAARQNLVNLFGQQPKQVWVVVDGVELEIPFEQLQAGDILVVDAGQMIPADGEVVEGLAAVDQHMLTGESQPAEKEPGSLAMASTVVLGGRLKIRVAKTGAATAAAQISEILSHTVEGQEEVQIRHFEIAERSFFPMLAGGALGWLLVGPGAGVAMLGCNFIVNMIPLRLLTLLNFLNTSSQRGILIKDGRALDRLQDIDTLVFDKTGTLTQDLPHIVQIHAVPGHMPDAVLALAAAAEQRQTHPIARAILAEAQARQFELPVFDEGNYRIGYGIEVRIDGRRVRVGSLRYMRMEGVMVPEEQQALARDCQALAHSLVFVAVDEALWGAIELEATLRPAAKPVIGWLKAQGYALHILSGDQEAPTRKLAEELGMDGYFANTLPEQKAEMIAELQRQGRKVCFIGDGINDSVALRQADVSISLRGASTVATDAAQIVLMDDDLAQLRTLFELSGGFHKNVRANFKLAVAASLAAVLGVLAIPLYKFWVVELMAAGQFVAGVGVASRPLLGAEEQPSDGAPAKPH